MTRNNLGYCPEDQAKSAGQNSWYALPVDAVANNLQTDLSSGLAPEEAASRLNTCGHNELVEKPRPGFLSRLWAQLTNTLVIILIVASVVSIFIGEYVDAAAIIELSS